MTRYNVLMAQAHNGFTITPGEVRSGAEIVDDAASMAHRARARLSEAEHEPTTFGSGSRALAFSRTVDSKRVEHVEEIRNHCTNLETVSRNAATLASNFEKLDR